MDRTQGTSPVVPGEELGGSGRDGDGRPEAVPAPEERRFADRFEGAAIMAAVFVSGAVLLGVEIAASRVLAPFFGNSL